MIRNKYHQAKKFCRFFTLLELLLVIALIAILASILLPALRQVKMLAKMTQCNNNMKQCGLALQMYINDFNGFFPSGSTIKSGTVADYIAWPMTIQELGYMGSVTDYNLTPNMSLLCPADSIGNNRSPVSLRLWNSYGYNVYSLGADCAAWFSNIKKVNNPTQRIMLGDSVYMGGGDDRGCVYLWPPFSTAQVTHSIFKRHGGKANILFVDGHAKNYSSREIDFMNLAAVPASSDMWGPWKGGN